MKSETIAIYKTKDNRIELKVQLEKDTVWLDQRSIAKLFGVQRPAITKHINNIFKIKELRKNSVSSILEHTAADGKNYKTRFYNLDMIISVGYRVNSSKATHFRIWATNTLRKYLVDGYVLNQERLKANDRKYQQLQSGLTTLRKVIENERFNLDQSKEIAHLPYLALNLYAGSF